MRQGMTYDWFLRDFNNKYNGLFIPASCYEDLSIPMNFTCTKCGFTFSQIPSYMLYEKKNAHWCPNCVRIARHEKFVNEVYKRCGDEYLVVGQYTMCKNKIEIKHNIPSCNRIFLMTPDGFLNNNHKCPICSHREGADKLFVSNDKFLSRVKSLHGDSITVLSEYKGYKEKVRIRHEVCGREFEVLAGDLTQGKGCRYCAGKMLKSHNMFVEQMRERYGDEYTVIGEYKLAKSKIKIRHNVCNYEWDIVADTILRLHICPNCNSSNGENEIENFLVHNKIPFRKQYIFKDCKDKGFLKFDFALLNDDDTINSLVEYDGEFHYEPIQYKCMTKHEANKRLVSARKRDNIKNKYCKDNNYPLLRISYEQKEDLNEILHEFVSDNLGGEFSVPTEYILGRYKNKYLKFIEYVQTLPNGIYEKSFILRGAGFEEKVTFASLMKNNQFFKFMMKDEFIIHRDMIEISGKNSDWGRYIQIGNSNEFSFGVFKAIEYLYRLGNGTHNRFFIDELHHIRAFKNFAVFHRFLSENNLFINSKTIKKAS